MIMCKLLFNFGIVRIGFLKFENDEGCAISFLKKDQLTGKFCLVI